MDDKEKKGWVDGTWYGGSKDKEQPLSEQNTQKPKDYSVIIIWLVIISFFVGFLILLYWFISQYWGCLKVSDVVICKGL